MNFIFCILGVGAKKETITKEHSMSAADVLDVLSSGYIKSLISFFNVINLNFINVQCMYPY